MNRAIRCIAFVSPLGGTGQTTLVANLANLWSTPQHSCLAVDLCAQDSLRTHLGRSSAASTPTGGWVACVEAAKWWGDAAQENAANVRFLPFGQPQAQPVGSTLVRNLQDPLWLQKQLDSIAAEDAPLVLLDAPAWPQALAQQALRCADVVVVCLDAAPRAPLLKAQVQAMLDIAPAHARQALLATRFDPRRGAQRQALEALQQQWHALLAPYVLHEDENVSAAHHAAHCVTAFAPQSQAAHDINGIAHWLMAASPSQVDNKDAPT